MPYLECVCRIILLFGMGVALASHGRLVVGRLAHVGARRAEDRDMMRAGVN